MSGVVFGFLNWYFMYRLYDKVFKLEKFKSIMFLLIKVVFLLGGLYLLIAVLKLSFIWFIAGITLSLAGAIFVLYKKSL